MHEHNKALKRPRDRVHEAREITPCDCLKPSAYPAAYPALKSRASFCCTRTLGSSTSSRGRNLTICPEGTDTSRKYRWHQLGKHGAKEDARRGVCYLNRLPRKHLGVLGSTQSLAHAARSPVARPVRYRHPNVLWSERVHVDADTCRRVRNAARLVPGADALVAGCGQAQHVADE